MPRNTATLVGLIVMFAAAAASAQDRRPAFGTILDHEGKPAPSARIVAVAARWVQPDAPDEVVQATADARAVFVAPLLSNRFYGI